MTSGMMWHDNSSTPLAQKVAKAAAYYLKKYGHAPELCLVNPSMKIDSDTVNSASGNSITIRQSKIVLPDHLWIGVEEMPIEEAK